MAENGDGFPFKYDVRLGTISPNEFNVALSNQLRNTGVMWRWYYYGEFAGDDRILATSNELGDDLLGIIRGSGIEISEYVGEAVHA